MDDPIIGDNEDTITAIMNFSRVSCGPLPVLVFFLEGLARVVSRCDFHINDDFPPLASGIPT